MKARVNESCIGCGLCVTTCPQVFEMTDEGVARAVVGELPAEEVGAALDAQSGCPVGAIEIG
ncbi:MAG TPA: ferredoxin [Candidatus Pygmaiobacter gallistercoris]|nr:ferredoxin [Candidatus Pygmaiobacter gallistercoris]